MSDTTSVLLFYVEDRVLDIIPSNELMVGNVEVNQEIVVCNGSNSSRKARILAVSSSFSDCFKTKKGFEVLLTSMSNVSGLEADVRLMKEALASQSQQINSHNEQIDKLQSKDVLFGHCHVSRAIVNKCLSLSNPKKAFLKLIVSVWNENEYINKCKKGSKDKEKLDESKLSCFLEAFCRYWRGASRKLGREIPENLEGVIEKSFLKSIDHLTQRHHRPEKYEDKIKKYNNKRRAKQEVANQSQPQDLIEYAIVNEDVDTALPELNVEEQASTSGINENST